MAFKLRERTMETIHTPKEAEDCKQRTQRSLPNQASVNLTVSSMFSSQSERSASAGLTLRLGKLDKPQRETYQIPTHSLPAR